MATFLKAVAVSAALIVGLSVTAVAAPVEVTAAAERTAPSTPLAVAVSAVGASIADLLSVPVDPSSEVPDRAAGTLNKSAVRKKATCKIGAKRKAVTGCIAAAKHKSREKLPSCMPTHAFLTRYYQRAWRLAMHTSNARSAMEVFFIARRHARQYKAARPGAKKAVVCNISDVEKRANRIAFQIMKRARDNRLRLPEHCRYRHMTPAEEVMMCEALAVPLNKPLPSRLVPKEVPMFI